VNIPSSPETASVESPSTDISPAASLLWLGLQVGALALAAGRVPLYAEYPQPGEFHALTILTVVQWLGMALLFPVLWTTWRGAASVAASGVVMLLFAGALSVSSASAILFQALYFALFVSVVFVWGEFARTIRRKMILAAVLAIVNLGGLLLAYLREDLSGGMSGGGKWKYGALLAALEDPQKPAEFGWILLVFVLAVGCLIRLLQWRRDHRVEGEAP
jgi:hypothetical protein